MRNILIILLVFLAFSCKKSEPKVTVLYTTPTSLTIEPGGMGVFRITSNVSWTVSEPTGYTVSPKSGKGNAAVSVTAGTAAPGGTVSVSGGGKSVGVTLIGSSDMTFSLDRLVFPDGCSSVSFDIFCTGAWRVVAPTPRPAWFKEVSPLNGVGNTKVTVFTDLFEGRRAEESFLTFYCGTYTKYLPITKAGKGNHRPTKPVLTSPQGTDVDLITWFTWTAAEDEDGDPMTYTLYISKGSEEWNAVAVTDGTKTLNPEPLQSHTTYYAKVVADDGFDNGKAESEVYTFTTGNTKSYYADGEVKQYIVLPDGTPVESVLGSQPKPFRLIFMGDGYTQELFNYGGQFDQETDAGIKALFEVEPYKHFYDYFTIYKVAAYSKEVGMSEGETYLTPIRRVNTKFQCTWKGGYSTSIDCNTSVVMDYASKCPDLKGVSALETGTRLTYTPISIVINADVYAGTNIWTSGIQGIGSFGGWGLVSIAQTPARHPTASGFANTLRHEYGGHGIGLLGDEYVYSNTPFPQENETKFRYWQSLGTYSNIYLPVWGGSGWSEGSLDLTPEVEGVNWNTFAARPDYAEAQVSLFSGAMMYGLGIYRSEYRSCMVDNIPHYNTVSRWKIYCRIKLTAGEEPTLEDFVALDKDRKNPYLSTKGGLQGRRCEGPLLEDENHKKHYRLR